MLRIILTIIFIIVCIALVALVLMQEGSPQDLVHSVVRQRPIGERTRVVHWRDWL